MIPLSITGIQIIALLLAGLMFYEARVLYRKGQFKQQDFLMWSALAGIIALIAIAPFKLSILLQSVTTLGRGLDMFLILGLFGAYGLIFQVYIRNQETQRQITNLVREVALRLEEHPTKKK